MMHDCKSKKHKILKLIFEYTYIYKWDNLTHSHVIISVWPTNEKIKLLKRQSVK